MVMAGPGKYQCSHYKYRGLAVCPERRLVKRQIAERRLLAGVKKRLLTPTYQKTFGAEVLRLLSTGRDEVPALQAQLRQVEAKLAKLVEALATIGILDTVATAIREAEAEKSRLEAELKAAGNQAAPIWLADLPGTFKRLVENLETVVGDNVAEAREALIGIIGEAVPVYWDNGVPYGAVKATIPTLTGTVDFDGSGGRILSIPEYCSRVGAA